MRKHSLNNRPCIKNLLVPIDMLPGCTQAQAYTKILCLLCAAELHSGHLRTFKTHLLQRQTWPQGSSTWSEGFTRHTLPLDKRGRLASLASACSAWIRITASSRLGLSTWGSPPQACSAWASKNACICALVTSRTKGTDSAGRSMFLDSSMEMRVSQTWDK